jgi:hypothetical protein
MDKDINMHTWNIVIQTTELNSSIQV